MGRMSRSSRQKEKHEKSYELSQHHYDGDTAARTRPVSFDEIMHRRKNKELCENVKEGDVESRCKSGDRFDNSVCDLYESEKDYVQKKDSSVVKKHSLKELVKETAGKKQENSFTKDDKLGKRSHGESHESDINKKHLSKQVVKETNKKKADNISTKDDKLAKEKHRQSHELETILKAEKTKDISTKDKSKVEKQLHDRKKFNERERDDFKSDAANKLSGDITDKDRHADRRRERAERERKRKYQNGDDEKNQERNAAKKHDLGRGSDFEISDRKEMQERNATKIHNLGGRHGLEISQRKEKQDRNATQKHDKAKGHDLEISERKKSKELSRSHYEELRQKHRRSRSCEREERSRRSVSLSPRTLKRASHHKQEHGDLSLYSFKSRTTRQHSDSDKRRKTTNGPGSHSRRFSGSTSGLGGYSPRKRRTEPAAKTPSPTKRSPEKKSAKWDVAPPGAESIFPGSFSKVQSSNQTSSSNIDEAINAVPVASAMIKPLIVVSSSNSSKNQKISIESVQLTQATRPMRRLYVENLPDSASEKAFMEFLNKLLLSSAVNHIQGTQPCISCIIHKEKGQALVEFLTPEDASAALCFDGSSFSGSTLKIRRPKDFVELATGEQEKPKAEAAAVVDVASDIVKDSPHKIFIGGIPKAFSSKMLMEIANAFGHLKAYRFEVNEDLREPCAFLEYEDHSVTLKACVGLNGMKLGGQAITAVQAVPNALFLENDENPPFYGIPEHAKPLLKKPTQVLKLKNVLNPEGLSSLSELEMEEALEDVRLECTRFGTVKSVNVVKYSASHVDRLEAPEVNGSEGSIGNRQSLRCEESNENPGIVEEVVEHHFGGISGMEFRCDAKEGEDADKIMEVNSIDDKPVNDHMENEPCEQGPADSKLTDGEQAGETISRTDIQEPLCDKVADDLQTNDITLENKSTAEQELNIEEIDGRLQKASYGSDGNAGVESDKLEASGNKKWDCDIKHIFEPGSVLVEFGRPEASCMAAHCLHGRIFDDQIVTVEYVALDLYRARFPN